MDPTEQAAMDMLLNDPEPDPEPTASVSEPEFDIDVQEPEEAVETEIEPEVEEDPEAALEDADPEPEAEPTPRAQKRIRDLANSKREMAAQNVALAEQNRSLMSKLDQVLGGMSETTQLQKQALQNYDRNLAPAKRREEMQRYGLDPTNPESNLAYDLTKENAELKSRLDRFDQFVEQTEQEKQVTAFQANLNAQVDKNLRLYQVPKATRTKLQKQAMALAWAENLDEQAAAAEIAETVKPFLKKAPPKKKKVAGKAERAVATKGTKSKTPADKPKDIDEALASVFAD